VRRPKSANREPKSAYEQALGLLARREHSARELARKLAQRGHEDEDRNAALAALKSKDFQSDERFGEMLVRTRIEAGYGPRWIVAELDQHGIGEAAARELIDAAAPDWAESARRQLRRRHGGKGPGSPAERARRAAFLLRRGFDASTVKLALANGPAGSDAD